MKKLIVAVATLISIPAFAGSICDKSWSDVDASSLYADFPKVQFGTIFLGVDGVCKAGQNLRTAQPVEVCTKWSTGESSDCVASEMKLLATPIDYIKEVPRRGEGSDFVEVPQTHPLNYTIEVGRMGESFQVVCKKAYSIPDCQ